MITLICLNAECSPPFIPVIRVHLLENLVEGHFEQFEPHQLLIRVLLEDGQDIVLAQLLYEPKVPIEQHPHVEVECRHLGGYLIKGEGCLVGVVLAVVDVEEVLESFLYDHDVIERTGGEQRLLEGAV